MTQAKTGDTVRFHFTGTLADGSTFASSAGQDPLTTTLGEGGVLSDIETALSGMAAGDNATVDITAEKGYGPHQPELIYEVEKDKFPPEIELKPGLALEATQPDGQPLMITIVELSETTVTVDENHPLAGQDLKFEIELVDIS